MTKKQKKNLAKIIISTVLLIGIIIFEKFSPISNAYIRIVAYLIPYLIISFSVLKKAVKNILKGQVFDENFLMVVASIGAIAIAIYENGSYNEAVFVMIFYQVGELFESYAVGKSRKNITSLMDIRPDYANVEIDEEIKQVNPDEVQVGSIIVVSAGEKVPIDGVIVEGSASFDTAALTGESVPRQAEVGSDIISGSINLNGTVRIRTTKLFGESTVSKILDLVENSSSKKSKSEQFITKFARYYTPAVCISALVLAIIPPIIRIIAGTSPMWTDWIYRALTFLIISCPCALVISIPLSFFGGIGGASRAGILIKGSNYLETLSKANIVVFDKTGTMTKGVFEVVEISEANGFSKEELLEKCAFAESYSSHPISKSLKSAYNKDIDTSRVSHVKEISGNGVTANVDNDKVIVGNSKLMKSENIEFVPCDKIGTVIYVVINNIYAGYILISDTLKENSIKAISELKKGGISKTIMLTGDSKKVADAVAKELGADEVYSELLPNDKVEKVEELLNKKSEKEKLAFVGDGINDAPVLSRADIGIAMGALGSDAAIEAADIVLMDDDPLKISKAIKISKKCLKIVYENIIFSLGVKGVCLILGALGIANMWLAIFADVGVMVIAVLNAIRALNTKNL